MIPPLPRRCGDQPTNPTEQLEEALVYIFETRGHEPFARCGTRDDNPARILCCRCIARNALLDAGWTLNPCEHEAEESLDLLDGPALAQSRLQSLDA